MNGHLHGEQGSQLFQLSTKKRPSIRDSKRFTISTLSIALLAWDKLIESVKEAADMPAAPKKTPEQWIQWIQSGDNFYELEMYDKALEAYEEAIHLEPNNALVYKKKGRTLYTLRRYKEALIAYKQVLRLDPNNADAYNNKGLMLRKLGRYEEALEAYEQAIRFSTPTISLRTTTNRLYLI